MSSDELFAILMTNKVPTMDRKSYPGIGGSAIRFHERRIPQFGECESVNSAGERPLRQMGGEGRYDLIIDRGVQAIEVPRGVRREQHVVEGR